MIPAVSPVRRLLSLAWPIIIQRATQAVVGLADALMVAPLGEAALAAVTTGALNTFVVIIFPMGTVFIVQSFAAQLRARNDWIAARRYAWYGLALAVLAAALAALLIPAVPIIVGKLEYPPEVRTLLVTYIAIRLLSVGPAVATEALVNWYGGLGNTRLAMTCGMIAMVANIALNALLIEPRFGLPGYGVAGAAAASVAASVLGFVPAWLAFTRGVGYEQASVRIRLKWGEFRRMLRFGLPNGVNWFLEFGAFVLFINLVIAHLGTTALAAFNVVLQLSSAAFMPAFGLSSAGSILVGEAIGLGQKERVAGLVKLTAKFTCSWMVSVGLCYLIAPQALLTLFTATDAPGLPAAQGADFVTVGSRMLIFGCFWQLFDALAMTLGEALRAAGDTAWPMWARTGLAWGCFFPGAWCTVMWWGGGVDAALSWVVGYLGVLSALLTARFLSGRWKHIQLVEEPALV